MDYPKFAVARHAFVVSMVVIVGASRCGGVVSKVPGGGALTRGPEQVAKEYALADVTEACEKAQGLLLHEEAKLLGKAKDVRCAPKEMKAFMEAAAGYVDLSILGKRELVDGLVEVKVEAKGPDLRQVFGAAFISGKDPAGELKAAAKTKTTETTVYLQKGPDGAWAVVHPEELHRARLGARYLAEKKVVPGTIEIQREYKRLFGTVVNNGDRPVRDVEGTLYLLDGTGARIGETAFDAHNLIPGVPAKVEESMFRNLPADATSVQAEVTKVELHDYYVPVLVSPEEAARASAYLSNIEAQLAWTGKNHDRDGFRMGPNDRRVQGSIRNKGGETVDVVQLRFEFLDAQGKVVAITNVDSQSTRPSATALWGARADPPLKAGYVKEFEITMGDEGPPGWARTLESIKVQPVAIALAGAAKAE